MYEITMNIIIFVVVVVVLIEVGVDEIVTSDRGVLGFGNALESYD